MHNIDELKQRLLHVWHGIDQTIIDNANDRWHGRLKACVREKGGLRATTCQPYDKRRLQFVKCDTIFRFLLNYHI